MTPNPGTHLGLTKFWRPWALGEWVRSTGLARPENRIDFNSHTEAFLSGCLGGRAEPLVGEVYFR